MSEFIEHARPVTTECPVCHHPPIRHEEDGTGAVCIVCLFLRDNAKREGLAVPNVCTQKFTFKLGKREREQARLADKKSYPPRTLCAICNCYWEAHQGYLCPSGDSTFIPEIDSNKPFLYTH